MCDAGNEESYDIPQMVLMRDYLHRLAIRHAAQNELTLDDLIGVAVSEYLERSGVNLPRPSKDYFFGSSCTMTSEDLDAIGQEDEAASRKPKKKRDK